MIDATAIAFSVDDRETTRQLAGSLQLRTLQLLHSADPDDIASMTGAFTEPRRGILHATGFILAPGGEVAQACYSTGPIGRFTAMDTLRSIRFAQNLQQQR